MMNSLMYHDKIMLNAFLSDKEIFKKIPLCPGVYQFYDRESNLLYVGKSVCLRKRVLSHFRSMEYFSRQKRLISQIIEIRWIETIGELGALLKEAQLIKQYTPIFNRRLRRYKNLFAIFLFENINTYSRLNVNNYQPTKPIESQAVKLFRHKKSAIEALQDIVKTNSLCLKLSGLEKMNNTLPCFYYQIDKCLGACINKENIKDYNNRVQISLFKYFHKPWPFTNKIFIQEEDMHSGRMEYHLIDQWCYIQTLSERQLTYGEISENKIARFDLDIYHILNSYLNNHKKHIKIIPYQQY